MANERDPRRGEPPKSGNNATKIVGAVVAVIIVLILAFWLWPTGDDPMVDEPNVEGVRQGEGTDPEGTADIDDEPSIGDEDSVIENGESTDLDPVTDQQDAPDSEEVDTTPGEAPADAGELAPEEPDEPVAEDDEPVVEDEEPVGEDDEPVVEED